MNNFTFMLKFCITAVWIIIIQVAIFDNLLLSNFVYIPAYLILFITMPRSVKTIPMMIISFALGMFMDYVSGSDGAITSAMVTLSLIRPFFIKYIIPLELISGTQTIKYRYVGFKKYISYISAVLLTFNVLLFALEGLSFFSIEVIIYKTVLSTITTIPVMLALQLFIFDKYE